MRLALILPLALAACTAPQVEPGEAITPAVVEQATTLRAETARTVVLALRGATAAVEARIEGMDAMEAARFENLNERAFHAMQQVSAAQTDDEFLMAVYFANVTLEDLTDALVETPDA